jgi:phospholipid N-methyltransferase
MSLRECLRFFSEFSLKPRVVGAVWPSSQRLARRMVEWIDWSAVRTVVEYGPGTGVFTEHIRERMQPGTKFLAIEINPEFAELIRSRYPDVRLYQDSVENVRSICDQERIDHVDAIISGLPWASFSSEQQSRFLGATLSALRPGGLFATFAYLQGLLMPSGRRFRRQLRPQFSHVGTSSTVWMNVPPAFVYRCRK